MERVCSSSVGLWMKTEVLIKQRISNDAGNRQAGRVSRSDPSQNLLKFVCGGIQLFSTSISRLALLLRRDDTAFFSALCGTNSVIPTTMSFKPLVLCTLCLYCGGGFEQRKATPLLVSARFCSSLRKNDASMKTFSRRETILHACHSKLADD